MRSGWTIKLPNPTPAIQWWKNRKELWLTSLITDLDQCERFHRWNGGVCTKNAVSVSTQNLEVACLSVSKKWVSRCQRLTYSIHQLISVRSWHVDGMVNSLFISSGAFFSRSRSFFTGCRSKAVAARTFGKLAVVRLEWSTPDGQPLPVAHHGRKQLWFSILKDLDGSDGY